MGSKEKYNVWAPWLIMLLLPLCASASSFKSVVTGIEGVPLENVKNRLEIKQHAEIDQLTPPIIHRLFEEAPREIRKALQPYGFFEPRIQSRLTHADNDKWIAYYTVDAGTPLKFTRIDIQVSGEGRYDRKLRHLLRHLPIHVGQKFSSIKYRATKNQLLTLASQRGYVRAVLLKNKVMVDVKRKTVDVILHLATGPRFHFGQVNFSKTPFSESFLRRFLNFKEGNFYSRAKLQTLQQDLSDSGFFSRVEVLPLFDETNKALDSKEAQYIPIEVKLLPSKAKQYIFGLGYGTDTGARGVAGVKFRHIGENGQHLQTVLKASELETKFIADYIIPASKPATDQYSVGLSFENQHHRPGRSRSLKLVERYTTVLGHWRQTLSLSALYDESRPRHQPSNSNFILYPKINWLYVKANNRLKPAWGYRVDFSLLGASRSVLSSINFFQVAARAKLITTLAHNNRFIFRGELGYTEVAELRKLPLGLSFYAGGAQSIRGYGYKSLGPGRQLVTASAEYQRRLFHDWYGVAFYDVGDISNHLMKKPKQGAGLGMVWLSHLGAIKLTVAKALSRRDRPLLIQFSMGPEL